MLKLTLLSSFVVAAAALRSYADRYVIFIKEPSDCGDFDCPTSTSYEVCGAGQCTEGTCGNYAGYKNYCCSVVHGTSTSPNCSEPLIAEFLSTFKFDTSGTPAEEGAVSCPSGGGFIGDGIKDKDGISCCNLDKDGVILYQNATFPYNTEGDPTKARCVDALVPIVDEDDSSSTDTPTPTDDPESTPTNTDAEETEATTPANPSPTPTPNSAQRAPILIGFMNALQILWFLVINF